jgi:hypothetical protein
MATKKKKAAKKKAAKKKEKELTDEDVFAAFKVGEGDQSLRAFISGQRKINGRLYRSIELIGKALQAGPGKRHNSCVAIACEINDKVPGDPPGCNPKGLPGGGD